MTGLVLYGVTLVELSGIFVPFLVGMRALRRTQRSNGFNRLVYGYVTLFAFAMFLAVLLSAPARGDAYTVSVIGAWMTLPLWLWICDQLRATPTRYARMLPRSIS